MRQQRVEAGVSQTFLRCCQLHSSHQTACSNRPHSALSESLAVLSGSAASRINTTLSGKPHYVSGFFTVKFVAWLVLPLNLSKSQRTLCGATLSAGRVGKNAKALDPKAAFLSVVASASAAARRNRRQAQSGKPSYRLARHIEVFRVACWGVFSSGFVTYCCSIGFWTRKDDCSVLCAHTKLQSPTCGNAALDAPFGFCRHQLPRA